MCRVGFPLTLLLILLLLGGTELLETELVSALNARPKVSGATSQIGLARSTSSVLKDAELRAGAMKDEYVSAEHLVLALAAGEEAAAFRRSLIAGQEALRLAATSEAIAHLERARQIAQDSSLRGAEYEAQIRELYLQLSQAYEQSGQHEQAQAVKQELAGLKCEQS